MISGYWIELFSGAGISAIVSLGLYLQMSSGKQALGKLHLWVLVAIVLGYLLSRVPFDGPAAWRTCQR
jgi:hypothetical protein